MTKIYPTDSFLTDVFPGFDKIRLLYKKIQASGLALAKKVTESDVEISVIEILLKLPIFGYILYLGFIIVFALLINTEPKNGYRIALVMSGSMEPAISQGSAVFIVPVQNPTVGDIVSFEEKSLRTQKKTGRLILHRIISETSGNYLTKGDANDLPDPVLVSKKEVLGKVGLFVPYLGLISHLVLSWWGILIFVLLPGILLTKLELTEIKALKKQVK